MELFGFEYLNTVILQAVHGTGDVTRQILCHVNTQLQLLGLSMGGKNIWERLQM